MDRRLFLRGLCLLPFLAGARGAPRALRVGVEACPRCAMTILDARYAAQAVNAQGRAYFFDDSACLLDLLNRWGGPSLEAREAYLADFGRSSRAVPAWVPAQAALLYHHPRIRTPMGSGLLAFAGEESLRAYLEARPEHRGGRLLTWAEALAAGARRPWAP